MTGPDQRGTTREAGPEKLIGLVAAEEAPVMAAGEAPWRPDRRLLIGLAAEEAPRAAEKAPGRFCECCDAERPREALVRHMNLKIGRVALRMIYDVHDFIGTCIVGVNPSREQKISGEAKRAIARLTTDLKPWTVLLGKIIHHRRLNEVSKHADRFGEVDTTGEVVYVRCNLHTGDLYVGETEHWEKRVCIAIVGR